MRERKWERTANRKGQPSDRSESELGIQRGSPSPCLCEDGEGLEKDLI